MKPPPDRPPECKIAGDKRTICEVHRELYDIAVMHLQGSPHLKSITDKLEEAYWMGKRMNAKLRQYKNNYDEGWWEQMSKEMRNEKHMLRNGG